MNLDWIVPCRFAEVHDNLATIVGGGIDTWWFPELPATVQVLVAVRLLATADELGPDHEHIARNVITAPDGTIISDLSAPFKIGSEEQAAAARTEWLNGISVVTVVQFQAEDPGSYSFEHMVDGSSKTVPMHIIHGLPPGMTPPTQSDN